MIEAPTQSAQTTSDWIDDAGVRLPARFPVAGVLASATTYEETTSHIVRAARAQRQLLVAATSVHGVTLAARQPVFRDTLNSFDIVTPDGQPVRWGLNLLYAAGLNERVYGPTLMTRVCEAAAIEGLDVYFYGSSVAVLEKLVRRMSLRLPSLRVAGYRSPPFRPMSAEEAAADSDAIRASGAHITFVGLGCPRQERWAVSQRERLSMPVVCVGAAFDFHSGALRQAPAWMQRRGLEWAFRLAIEPRRLWRRYARAVPLFMFLLGRQYITTRLGGRVSAPFA